MQKKIFQTFFRTPSRLCKFASPLAYTNISLLTSRASKISTVSKYQFNTTNSSQIPRCKKISESLQELLMTLEHNFPDFLKAIPNRGISVSSLLYYGLAYISHRDLTAYDILSSNMLKSYEKCFDIPTLKTVLEGLELRISQREFINENEKTLLNGILGRLTHLKPLIKMTTRKEIVFLIENIAIASDYKDYKKYLDIFNSPEVTDAETHKWSILKALNLDEIAKDIQDVLEITELSIEKNLIRLKNLRNAREVFLFGCEPYPSDSIREISQLFDNNPKQFNYLLIEDAPLLIEPDEQPPPEKERMLEHITKMNKSVKIVQILEGDSLLEYISSFVRETELLTFNPTKDIILTNYNQRMKVPNEIATINYKFNKNADKSKNPKIKLADMIITEVVGYLMKVHTVEELQSIVKLVNYFTLVEKTRFALYSQKNGCLQCNNSITQLIPKDILSSISGDKEYPLDEKTAFFGRQVFDTLNEKILLDKFVAVFGSFHLMGILSNVLKLTYESKRKNIQTLDRKIFMQSLTENIAKENENDKYDMYEKLAILETIHQVTDPAAFEALDLEKETIDFRKYIKYLDQYSYEMSYEALLDKSPNSDFVKFSPEACLAESLIFGDEQEESQQAVQQKVQEEPEAGKKDSKKEETLEEKLHRMKSLDEIKELRAKAMGKSESEGGNDGKIRLKSEKDLKGKKKKN